MDTLVARWRSGPWPCSPLSHVMTARRGAMEGVRERGRPCAPFLSYHIWREDIATTLYGLQNVCTTNGIKESWLLQSAPVRWSRTRCVVKSCVLCISPVIQLSCVMDLRLLKIFALGRGPKEPGSLQLRRRHKRP